MYKLLFSLVSVLLFAACSIFKTGNYVPEKKIFKIADIELLGSIWNESYNKYHIISQDGGSSFDVPGGSIWCFGDTFKGTRDKSGKPHFKGGGENCSIAFMPKDAKPYPPELQYFTGKDGTAETPFSYLGTETAEKNSIWPLAGIYANGKSYLYYTEIEKTGNGSWDFKHIGDGLAVADKPLSPYSRIVKNGTWKFPVHVTAIVSSNNWLYLYSIKNTDKYKQGAFLSRVKPSEIENPDAYEYFCGINRSANEPVFSKNIENEKVMLDEVYGQTSVVWNQYLGKYLLASSSSFWNPYSIKFYWSDTPYGPWFDTGTEVKIPKKRQNKDVELVYCAFFHPELFKQDGKIMYLTYSLMLKDSGFDANCEMVSFEIEKIKQ